MAPFFYIHFHREESKETSSVHSVRVMKLDPEAVLEAALLNFHFHDF